jgi:hypothetical protein
VVKKDPRSFRYVKDQLTKIAHPFVRVLRGPTWF